MIVDLWNGCGKYLPFHIEGEDRLARLRGVA